MLWHMLHWRPEGKVFAGEPALAPLLSCGKAGPHPIQGLGANFIPSILNTEILDGIIDVDADEAKEMARRAARESHAPRTGPNMLRPIT